MIATPIRFISPIRRWLATVLLLAGCLSLGAQAPEKPDKPEKSLLDKLPEGAIIIIAKDPDEALRKIPGAVVLKPEEFKKYLDQIEQLKRLGEPAKVEFPSRCRLSGKLDGDLVRLEILFEFETTRPRTLVGFGCQKAWPTAASLDDADCPLIPPAGEEGFLARIDKAGSHRLKLDLDVPLLARGARGTDRGIELDLPRAAITLLDHLDLPDAVKEVRIGQRLIPAKLLRKGGSGPAQIALGPIDKLDISWNEPAPRKPAERLATALGRLEVQVTESAIIARAELTLRLLRGQTDTWRIHTPPGVEVEVKTPAQDLPPFTIQPPPDAKKPVWTIKLESPTAEPILVEVRQQQPRPAKPGSPVAIGPFFVQQAARQQGTIVVAAPTDVRLRYQLRGEISQREVTDDLKREAFNVDVFNYWNLPAAVGGQPPPAPLTLEIEPAKGAVEARVSHILRLTEQGWQITTRLEATPIRSAIDRLELILPADYQYDAAVGATPASLVEDVVLPSPDNPHAIVKLGQKQRRLFEITLVGLHPLLPGQQQSTLELPRPALEAAGGTPLRDRGGQVTVLLPAGLELVRFEGAGGPLVRDARAASGPREQTLRWERIPSRLELTWRPARQDLAVEAQADLQPRGQQMLVRQKFRLQGALGRGPLLFRILTALEGRLPAVDGGVLVNTELKNTWAVALKDPGARDATLVLTYAFPLPDADAETRTRRFGVPLAWLEAATSCRTTVCVWSDPGAADYSYPKLEAGPWDERPTLAVPDRDTLPALVLQGIGLDLPLALRLVAPPAGPLATIVVDRALVQALVQPSGLQSYRVRYRLIRFGQRWVDVELPASAASLNLVVLLDGKGVSDLVTLDQSGRESGTGRVVRIRCEVDPGRKLVEAPAILELRYQVRPDAGSRWRTVFLPPRLLDQASLGQVRWQVGLPPGEVSIWSGSGFTLDRRWGWRGWLPAPQPAYASGDLERWFYEPAAPRAAEAADFFEGRLDSGDTLTGWQTSIEPLALFHAPEAIWLLACSLTFLVLGLLLYYLALPARILLPIVGMLALAVIVGAIAWPSVLPVVLYGCQPGLLILIVVVSVQWMLQRRYRRRVIFMPGFSRMKTGSSLTRTGSSKKPRAGEPSTLDVGPVSGSSASKKRVVE